MKLVTVLGTRPEIIRLSRVIPLLDGHCEHVLVHTGQNYDKNLNELFFDERFDFHFYDLDFCRQAEAKGLSCGTWDLSLVHESGGSFGTERWKRAYAAYLEKWGE